MLQENFAVLVARVIVDNIPFFEEDHRGLILRHIQHKYSKEMAIKSEVVSLRYRSRLPMFLKFLVHDIHQSISLYTLYNIGTTWNPTQK